MVRTSFMPMEDSELRQQLEAKDTIFFVGEDVSLQEIERQVERLGFGELYIVSASHHRQPSATRINVKPVDIAA